VLVPAVQVGLALPVRNGGGGSTRCAPARRSVPASSQCALNWLRSVSFGRYRTGWIRDGVLLSVG